MYLRVYKMTYETKLKMKWPTVRIPSNEYNPAYKSPDHDSSSTRPVNSDIATNGKLSFFHLNKRQHFIPVSVRPNIACLLSIPDPEMNRRMLPSPYTHRTGGFLHQWIKLWMDQISRCPCLLCSVSHSLPFLGPSDSDP